MARLSARERAQLPDSAFAYIDADGKRRLPIHDAAHVRAALARFNQVPFSDDAAQDRARTRLLRAAQRHGIMPIGFLNAQLQPHRRLPKGTVTFLMTDLEGSTALLSRLGDGYASVLNGVRRIQRDAVRSAGGQKVDARGDDYLAVFEESSAALNAALEIQRELASCEWPDGGDVRLRIGLHRGRPTLTENGYVGLSVHAVARICFAGHGGQILLSGVVSEAIRESLDAGVKLKPLGSWRFQGLPDPIELFQAGAGGNRKFPPLRAATPAG
jgi:class 3 adenylate cyclase